jgi:uncharacterized membrane protein YfcA
MSETFIAVLNLDLVWTCAISLLSGLMLGYTGWGGALVAMPLLVFLFGPVEALLIVMIGAGFVIARLVPDAARQTNWKMMMPLLIAMVVTVPVGSWMLFFLDPDVTRRIMGFVIVAASILVLTGWRYRGPMNALAGAVVGCVSGVINGFIGLGGPPLVIYMLASNMPSAEQRANILIAMAVVTLVILISMGVGGGVTLEGIYRGLIAAPFQMAGGAFGAWLFKVVPDETFKKFSLIALVVLGVSVALF